MLTTVRVSSKGQIVIPQRIREELGIEEGTVLHVTRSRDAMLLQKTKVPTQEERLKALEDLGRSAAESQKRLEKLGWTEQKVIETALRERYRRRSLTRTSSSPRASGRKA